MGDADDTASNGPQNLLKNTDPKKRAAIAAAFGGSSDSDDKQAKLDAMKRRMGDGT